MGLEKLFAEVQVLVANIVGRRQLSSQELPGNPPIDFYGEGIVRESENMARAYRGVLHTLQYSKRKIPNQKVARRVREQSRTASSYMGEFALCTKNFADNLNRFLQSLYGARKMDIDLRDLKERVQDAPRTTDNREIYEVFSQVHDPRGDLTHLRNARGHGNGHLIVSWDDYFLIPIKDGSVEAKVWLDQQAQAYLGMAKTILETIYEKEQKVLSSRKDSKPHSLTMQRIKNFTKAHSNTARVMLASALVSAGVVGGVIGTLGYQQAKEQERRHGLIGDTFKLESSLLQTEIFVSESQADLAKALEGIERKNSEYYKHRAIQTEKVLRNILDTAYKNTYGCTFAEFGERLYGNKGSTNSLAK